MESDCSEPDCISALNDKLENFYHKSTEAKAVEAVAELVSDIDLQELDAAKISQEYLLVKNDRFGKAVVKFSKEKRDGEIS